MYAEQLSPRISPAMQNKLSAPAFNNKSSFQNVVFGDQQRHPVSSSQHMQASGHQQKQAPVSAYDDALWQAAHRAETRQGAQPVPASASAPSSSRASGRQGAADRHARSSTDRRHQRQDDSRGAHGQGRPAGSNPRKGPHSPHARKGQQGPVTDSRQVNSSQSCHVAFASPRRSYVLTAMGWVPHHTRGPLHSPSDGPGAAAWLKPMKRLQCESWLADCMACRFLPTDCVLLGKWQAK